MSKFQFQKATKQQMKARVAISGPAGSGKTTNALQFAKALTGDLSKVAVIDTERGSASLYADRFNGFATLDFTPPYDPRTLCDVIDEAAANNFECLVIDSLSHFWSGEGGVLEQVDKAGSNKFTNGWGQMTPVQNRMVEKILAYPGHVIVTLRSKTAYAVDASGGKAVPRKVGQAPIQRDGLEYEFTLVLDLDRDHSVGISKTRCAALETTGFVNGTELPNLINTFITWLGEGDTATVPVKTAKVRLYNAFIDKGWKQTEAKSQAAHLWSEADVSGDKITQDNLDSLLARVPAAAEETDVFAVDTEEVAS
jgi:hypothetical protein